MSDTARPKFCPECGTRLHGDERFCGGCGQALVTSAPRVASVVPPETLAQPAQAPRVPAAPTHMPSTPRRQGATPAARKRNPLVDWTVAFAVLSVFVITVLLVGKKDPHSKLGKIAWIVADVARFGHGLDGTYVSDAYSPPLSIKIDGDTASWDLGVALAYHLRVERHGNTVSLSGGEAKHPDGRLFTAEELRSLEGGNDVTLLTLGDDEQTLTSHDPDGAGNMIVFTKQR